MDAGESGVKRPKTSSRSSIRKKSMLKWLAIGALALALFMRPKKAH